MNYASKAHLVYDQDLVVDLDAEIVRFDDDLILLTVGIGCQVGVWMLSIVFNVLQSKIQRTLRRSRLTVRSPALSLEEPDC